MAPGSCSNTYAISYHICFQSTFICIFTFCIYIRKYQKYIYLILLSLLDLTFASGREGIDNPFIALVASLRFVCVGAWDFLGASYWIDTLVLKTKGNTYATLVASPSPLRGKPTQAQDIAFTHSLKVGALNVAYGGVTQITQVVVAVALLTWELGQLIIYGASGEVMRT